MLTATVQPRVRTSQRVYGPEANGLLMTPTEYDRGEFERGYRYELINGVLIVSPPPLEQQRGPNDHLGQWLWNYKEMHPQGNVLDYTLPEHPIHTGTNRRIVDRAIWVGLGRRPRKRDVPRVAIEFVSAGKPNIERDYEIKRDENMACGVEQYWVIDRFRHLMTVFYRKGNRILKKVIKGDQVYTTDLLPGFELPLARLFELADAWDEVEDD